MKAKSILKGAAITLLGVGAVITECHQSQVREIEMNCSLMRNRTAIILDAEKEVREIQRMIRNSTSPTKNDLEFLVGDFRQNEKGEVRCGGAAKLACEEGAKRGFESEIRLTMVSIVSAHYYAVLKHDGKEYEIR